MEALAHAMLSNALVAAGLALVPAALAPTRARRSPALIHSLWLLVLLKLVTPPLVTVPLELPLSGAWGVVPSTWARFGLAAPAPHPNPPPQGGRGLEKSPPPQVERIPSGKPPPLVGEGWVGGKIDWPLAGRLEAEADVIAPPAMASRGEHPEPEPGSLAPPVDRGVLIRWEGAFLIVVLAGGLACWGLAAVRIGRFHRLLGAMGPAPEDLQDRVATIAGELGLRRAPRVRLVPGRVPPMLWAFGGRARLLVPSALWPRLSAEQQAALLAHELAHLKRKDHWVRWLDLAVAGLYWWNPVAWWARRALREAEEECCDAWAVGALPRGGGTYAAALLAALEFISGTPTADVAAASAAIGGRRHVSCLQRRMRMIVRAKTPRGLSWAGRLGVLGLAALILPLAPIRAQDDAPARPDKDASLERKLDELVKQLDDTVRQQLKAEADDDDDDKDGDKDKDRDHKEVADQLERLLKDLGEKLSKDLGPVGEEIVNALDRAAKEVGEALDKGGVISKDLQEAFDKAREELHQAFRSGGKIDQEAREGLEKARQHLGDAVDRAKDDLKETARDRADEARRRAREQFDRAREAARDRGERNRESLRPQAENEEQEPPGDAGAREARAEVERARAEVRRMEAELRRAMRQLQAIERREVRRARIPGRGADEAPAPEAPTKPPAPPKPPVPPVPPQPPAPPEGHAGHPAPPATPDEPAPPDARRGLRGPGGLRGRVGPGLGPGPGPMRGPGGLRGRVGPGPGPGPGGPPVANPRVERRLRDLEEKLDRLLKELDGLKGEKKDKEKADDDEGEV